jgi:ABC-2 type transport system permease protein
VIADILTVMWKEWRSLFRAKGSVVRFLIILTSWSYFSVYSPWVDGPRWLDDSVLALTMAFFLPTVLVAITVTDSFAGERERHTLETLLASRLPDRAILFGKMGFSVIIAWGTALVMLLLGVVIANVTHWQGRVEFFGPLAAAISIAGSLLAAILAASLGVIISMRSATVQEAAQLMTAIMLGPPMILGTLLLVFMSRVGDFFKNWSGELVLMSMFAIMVILAAGLLYAAMARFQRSRLV